MAREAEDPDLRKELYKMLQDLAEKVSCLPPVNKTTSTEAREFYAKTTNAVRTATQAIKSVTNQCSSIPTPQLPNWIPLASPEEQEARRFKRARAKEEFVAAEAALAKLGASMKAVGPKERKGFYEKLDLATDRQDEAKTAYEDTLPLWKWSKKRKAEDAPPPPMSEEELSEWLDDSNEKPRQAPMQAGAALPPLFPSGAECLWGTPVVRKQDL